MRSCLLALLFLLLPAAAEPTSFLDGVLSLEVPGSFRALDQSAIDEMFAGASSRPGAVLATPDSETRISLTHTQASLSQGELEQIKETLKSRMDQSTVWVRDEMLLINGAPWFRLDYEVGSGAAARREIIVGTSARERLLFLVIATPAEDREMLENELQSLIGSLRLSP